MLDETFWHAFTLDFNPLIFVAGAPPTQSIWRISLACFNRSSPFKPVRFVLIPKCIMSSFYFVQFSSSKLSPPVRNHEFHFTVFFFDFFEPVRSIHTFQRWNEREGENDERNS